MTGMVRDLPTLLTWLEAQIDADEALAVAMRDAVWPEEVWVAASEDTGAWREDGIMARVTVGPQYSPKAYSRVWYPGWPAPLDYTDSPHGAEVAVWSLDVAARALAECAAKRRILGRHAPVVGGVIKSDARLSDTEWQTVKDRWAEHDNRSVVLVDLDDGMPPRRVAQVIGACSWCTRIWPCPDVLDVAVVYQDRDGWQEGWAPNG